METLLVHIALLAYAAGAAAFLAWLVRPLPRRAEAGRWFPLAGVVIHLCAFTMLLGLGEAAAEPFGLEEQQLSKPAGMTLVGNG